MSWPHILSISRILAAAPIAGLILAGRGNALLWAALLFAAASLTDLLDGPLARRGRTVGPVGIYLDTTGDKVLVSVVLIAMSAQRIVDPWMVAVIVAREFLVSGVRTLAAVQGFVISANLAGKIKTSVTLAAMFLLLVAFGGIQGGAMGRLGNMAAWRSAGWFGMLLATGLTVFSGLRYILDARPLFFPSRRFAGLAAWERGSGGDIERPPGS